MPSDSYRSSWLDRMFAESRTIVMTGPIPDLDESRVRVVLEAAAAVTDSRITLVPDGTARRWRRHRPVLARVVSRPDVDVSDVGAALTAMHNRPDKECPIEVFVCGDYLIVDYSHGLGDGWLGEVLTRSLVAGDPGAAAAIAKPLPSNALWTAVASSILRRPATISATMRLRKATKSADAQVAPPPRPTDWRSSMRCATRSMGTQQTAELKAWAKQHAPTATTNAVSTAVWMAALRACGATVDPQVMVLMNCRRYLPPDLQDANGNFAFAMPVELPASPTGIAQKVRQITDSGWPLTILAVADLKSRLSRGTQSGEQSAVFGNGLRLAISDMGNLKWFEQLSWTAGRQPMVTGFLETDGPDSVAMIITLISGVRTFTATFSTESIDPALIDSALEKMCADPVGLLQGLADATP